MALRVTFILSVIKENWLRSSSLLFNLGHILRFPSVQPLSFLPLPPVRPVFYIEWNDTHTYTRAHGRGYDQVDLLVTVVENLSISSLLLWWHSKRHDLLVFIQLNVRLRVERYPAGALAPKVCSRLHSEAISIRTENSLTENVLWALSLTS